MDFLREQQLGLVSRAVQAVGGTCCSGAQVSSLVQQQLQVLVTHFFNDSFKNAFAAAAALKRRRAYVYVRCDANSATFHALKSLHFFNFC